MAKQDKKVVQEERKIIKETKYCEVYKDTFKMQRQFIPRSLDLTEKQLLELIKESYWGKGIFRWICKVT